MELKIGKTIIGRGPLLEVSSPIARERACFCISLPADFVHVCAAVTLLDLQRANLSQLHATQRSGAFKRHVRNSRNPLRRRPRIFIVIFLYGPSFTATVRRVIDRAGRG